jgi:ATP-binding cassette subfamily G (WHITE) protein 2 (SNQ2)
VVRRQVQLKLQDWFSIFTSYFTAIVLALIIGSVYLNLPQTVSGAFTRGGVLFLGLLFCSLNAFSELPSQMQGRSILYKQTGYRLYRPSAVSLSASIADVPFTSLNVFLFRWAYNSMIPCHVADIKTV